jgi:hypothetical protein
LPVCSALRDMGTFSLKTGAELAQRHRGMTLRKLRLVNESSESSGLLYRA